MHHSILGADSRDRFRPVSTRPHAASGAIVVQQRLRSCEFSSSNSVAGILADRCLYYRSQSIMMLPQHMVLLFVVALLTKRRCLLQHLHELNCQSATLQSHPHTNCFKHILPQQSASQAKANPTNATHAEPRTHNAGGNSNKHVQQQSCKHSPAVTRQQISSEPRKGLQYMDNPPLQTAF